MSPFISLGCVNNWFYECESICVDSRRQNRLIRTRQFLPKNPPPLKMEGIALLRSPSSRAFGFPDSGEAAISALLLAKATSLRPALASWCLRNRHPRRRSFLHQPHILGRQPEGFVHKVGHLAFEAIGFPFEDLKRHDRCGVFLLQSLHVRDSQRGFLSTKFLHFADQRRVGTSRRASTLGKIASWLLPGLDRIAASIHPANMRALRASWPSHP